MSKLLRLAVAVTALLAMSTNAGAADPGVRVFGDGTNDAGPLAPDFTPPYQDLVAGHIGEDASTISFTWEVADLSLYAPQTVQFYWDFAIAPNTEDFVDCSTQDSACFSVGASLDATGPRGTLEVNCQTTATNVECELVEDANVVVTIDGNRVTATVERADLGSPAAGAVLYEVEELFLGISAFTKVGLSFGTLGDQADMCVDTDGSALCAGFYTFQTG